MACLFPFMVENSGPTGPVSLPVPCGRCYDCKMRSINQWIFRIQQEELASQTSYFVTLTYSTTEVPITKSGYMTLHYKDVQDFWKRLRKISPGLKIKYFVVGEYGSKRMRPHYHAIVLNAQMSNVAKAWTKGDVHFGSVSGASIAYTLKYMLKESKIPQHPKDDRVREFRKMSKGLGECYLSKEIRKFHLQRPNDFFVRNVQGHIIAMPRYYRIKIYGDALTSGQIRAAEAFHQKVQASKERELQAKFKKGSVNTNILEDYERQQKYYKQRRAEDFQEKKRGDQ